MAIYLDEAGEVVAYSTDLIYPSDEPVMVAPRVVNDPAPTTVYRVIPHGQEPKDYKARLDYMGLADSDTDLDEMLALAYLNSFYFFAGNVFIVGEDTFRDGEWQGIKPLSYYLNGVEYAEVPNAQ